MHSGAETMTLLAEPSRSPAYWARPCYLMIFKALFINGCNVHIGAQLIIYRKPNSFDHLPVTTHLQIQLRNVSGQPPIDVINDPIYIT